MMTLLLHPASAGTERQSSAVAAATIKRERFATEALLGIAFPLCDR